MPLSTTATVRRTQLREILLACRARLMAVTEFPKERVRFFDPDLAVMPPPQADQVIHFWPDISSSTDTYLGAGRVDHRRQVRLVVQVATFFGVDEDDSQEQWLLDKQAGHLAVLEMVDDAMVQFVPEDALRNMLETHPIEPTTVTKPQPDKKEPGWGYSRLGYLVTREVPLNQSYG